MIEYRDNKQKPQMYRFQAEASGCDIGIINDADACQKASLRVTQDLELNVLESTFTAFPVQGVTGTLVLGESHYAIHTWPERNGYAFVDILTCSPFKKPEVAPKSIIRHYRAEKIYYDFSIPIVTSELTAEEVYSRIKEQPVFIEV